MSKTILIDAGTAGASGDMILSALIDLIGDDEAIVPVAASLLIYDPSLRVRINQESRSGLSGKRLEVTMDKGVRFSPESLLGIIDSVSEELEISKKATKFAKDALNAILLAESRAHDKPINELQLHETGSVDTILDIVGAAYLLEKAGFLGEAKILCTKVAVGSGTINTEHGELEVPVPAVSEIIVEHDMPIHTGEAKTEVLTPTGAALLVTMVDEFVESADEFILEKQGLGFGLRDLGEIENVLKISLGVLEITDKPGKKPEAPKKARPSKKEEKPKTTTPKKTKKIPEERAEMLDDWNADEVIVIEANVDDADGEVMGALFDVLLSEGLAYDVVMIPAYGKKNRPCFVVKVIAAKAGLKSVAEIMIRHLGTLGIRYTEWSRLKVARETVVCSMDIDDVEYMVRVKVSRGADGSIVNIKPEADDIVKVSKATGIPIRELKPRIVMQARAVTE
ncbi:MAG: nickel pincer cofactor biosynthesis protein LarC [Candidatus Thorarchaeota archaeon]|nr:nickel pincer cofactor biosynthesis protein LarC [Candidatus Thorarchaeota archaeon]